VRQVTVAAIPGIVAAGAAWKIAWQGTDNADGLVAAADGGLLFAQEQPSRVSKLDANDRVSVEVERTHGAGSLGVDAMGRIFAVQRTCTDPGLNAPCSEPTAIAIISPERDRRTLADNVDGKPLGRLNDLVVAKSGGVYFTSGGAFYMSPAGRVLGVGENLRTNGIMLSRDERTLYVTNGSTIVAFDIGADGTTANQRDFGKLEGGGAGDGMAIDETGRLYVTTQPGVQILSAEGRYLGLIPTPRPVISVAFAGRGKTTMYVVGSGALDADGREVTTPPGVRNNAKSIFRIDTLTRGFSGRAK
jgi:gluconolactonase